MLLPRQVGEPRPAFDHWGRQEPRQAIVSAMAWPPVEEYDATVAATRGTEAQARSGHARYYGLGGFFEGATR